MDLFLVIWWEWNRMETQNSTAITLRASDIKYKKRCEICLGRICLRNSERQLSSHLKIIQIRGQSTWLNTASASDPLESLPDTVNILEGLKILELGVVEMSNITRDIARVYSDIAYISIKVQPYCVLYICYKKLRATFKFITIWYVELSEMWVKLCLQPRLIWGDNGRVPELQEATEDCLNPA